MADDEPTVLRSRVFRCVVEMEVLAIVTPGADVDVGDGCLLVPRSGDVPASKWDPESEVREGVHDADCGPDIAAVAGESRVSVIEELSGVERAAAIDGATS
jgi:hypothetical protein